MDNPFFDRSTRMFNGKQNNFTGSTGIFFRVMMGKSNAKMSR
ncbi:hypothetical protein BN2497_10473 [Janthinobacterium sp. CG23_2]|nr:hypothetical protein BN2497_10473 [Janthinobacterium sp. CG23_2]CUU31634.1 hypothetical protein BN3177_10473 [Janthinobacterium sp. CG23_2]